MAIAKLKYVEILGFFKFKEKVIERLQEAEIFHLEREERVEEGRLKNIERIIKVLKDFEGKKFLEEIFPEGVYVKKDDFKNFSPQKFLPQVQTIEESIKKREEILKEKNNFENKRKETSGRKNKFEAYRERYLFVFNKKRG